MRVVMLVMPMQSLIVDFSFQEGIHHRILAKRPLAMKLIVVTGARILALIFRFTFSFFSNRLLKSLDVSLKHRLDFTPGEELIDGF